MSPIPMLFDHDPFFTRGVYVFSENFYNRSGWEVRFDDDDDEVGMSVTTE